MQYAMVMAAVAALLVSGCEAVKQTGAQAGNDLGSALNQTTGQAKESQRKVTEAPQQLQQAGKDAQGTAQQTASGAKEQVSGTAQQAAGEQKIMKTEALKALLDARTPMVVVDARTRKFDDGKRIPGAKSLSPEATEDEVAQTVGEVKGSLIVAYCAGPTCPASHTLARKLKGMGYTNVVEYSEGMPGWEAAGMPVEKVEVKAVGAPVTK